MNPSKSEAETETGRYDTLLWSVAVVIVVAAMVAFYWFAEALLAVRVVGLLAAVAVAVAIAARTRLGAEVLGYLRDSRVELRKVVWPMRQETLQTTLAVFLMVTVMGIFLWLLDMLLLWGVRVLTGQGA